MRRRGPARRRTADPAALSPLAPPTPKTVGVRARLGLLPSRTCPQPLPYRPWLTSPGRSSSTPRRRPLPRCLYGVVIASRTDLRPWDDSDGFEPTVDEWRYEDPSERTEKWAVEDDGQVVGVATLFLSLDDNTDKIWAEVDVHPDHRGRGAGTALAQVLERRGRELGRPEVLVEVYLPPVATGEHPFERFAASQGFIAESTDNVRILDLPDRGRPARPARGERAGAVGGRIPARDVYRRSPDALVEGYCRVSNLLNVDAPTGAVDFEAETLTPERYRGYLDLERRQGRQRLTTVAIEEATGEVVAFTDLVLPSGAPTKAWQWGTLVDRAHRGHRLGMAVKVANLRELQSAHPERTTVSTGNDATNSYMVGINVEIGFHVVGGRPDVPQGAHRPLSAGRYGVAMLVAFSVAPAVAADDTGSVSEAVAPAIRVVRESGLPNRTDSMFTTLEGEWDEVMAVVKGAVDAVAAASPRVSLVLKADIRPGFTGELEAKVARIDELLADG